MSTPFLHALRPSFLALVGALLVPAAQAGIVLSPKSIVVSQDGTYITDTVNQRDWYKFNNVQSTVGSRRRRSR